MSRKLTPGEKKQVDGRLLHWAAAYGGDGYGARLGVSAMFMMSEGGGGEVPIPIDELAEEVDQAVRNLPDRERDVIREFYLVTDSTAEQKYRATGTNKDSFSRAKIKGMLLIFMELTENKVANRKLAS